MSHQEFHDNWKRFSELITKMPTTQNEQLNVLLKRYIEQNVTMLNDMMKTSIDNLSQLTGAECANDILCLQARFTSELNKKMALSTKRFLNASLGHIADYNEWLRAHCDFATD